MPFEISPNQTPVVFISYCHKDMRYKNLLVEHLITMKKNNEIKTWHDKEITAGEIWEKTLFENRNNSDIYLFLLSVDFLNSIYCEKEFVEAQKKQQKGFATIIPIVVRPCDWEKSDFGEFQALPSEAMPISDWEKEDNAYLNIIRGLRKSLERNKSNKINITDNIIRELREYPTGKRADLNTVSDKLLDDISNCIRYQNALETINLANELKLKAKPSGKYLMPNVLKHPIGVTPHEYWTQAIHEACLQSHQMLAALLMAVSINCPELSQKIKNVLDSLRKA